MIGWFDCPRVFLLSISRSLMSGDGQWPVSFARGRIMWKMSVLDVLWVIWKERIGASKVIILLCMCWYTESDFLPLLGLHSSCFKGISVDSILRGWHEVAFPSLSHNGVQSNWYPSPCD